VVEVGHFWGYRIDERNAELLKQLTAEINRLELVPLPIHPHPDLVCLAPFTDYNKESYFRAQILYVSGNSAEVCFSVNRKGKNFTENVRTGEMAQWLRALTAFPEDPSSIPSNHMETHNHL
jgi:hypothetical protein